MVFNKKAISPVVATALLLVVAVVAVVGFQAWFNTYQSGLTGKIESQSGNLLTVNRLENGTVYIKNTGSAAVNVTDVYIKDAAGNNLCTPMTTSFLIGANSLSTTSVADCGANLTQGNTYTVLIFTESGDIFDPVAIRR